MTKPVILTGLRANNDLTLGNYFGAVLPMIDMAKTRSAEYQINMFIPDLHSFTTPIDHLMLYEQILHNARLFVAAGLPLDNDDIHLYRQSFVPAHSELTWILDCFTGFGEMSRMTQFKDKSGTSDFTPYILEILQNMRNEYGKDIVDKIMAENASEQPKDARYLLMFSEQIQVAMSKRRDASMVGLFNYPVLMAADILLYGAKYVPVGDDQSQHLEFTRDIGERINKRFNKDIFTIPEPVAEQHNFFGNDQGLRIKDLIDPTKKMSKSDESGRGVIFLSDAPEVARKKVMGATTDDKAEIHFDRENQPGISNLLEILALLRGQPLDQVIAEFEGQTRYGDFKKVVADEVAGFLTDFQAQLAAVDDAAIVAKLESSEAAMNQIAGVTLLRVQRAVGLRSAEA